MINRTFSNPSFNELVVHYNNSMTFLKAQCVDDIELSKAEPGKLEHFLCLFDWLHHIYLRRALNLADNYSILVTSKQDLAATVIGRALIETTAHFHFLLNELRRYINLSKCGDAYHLVSSYMLGGNHGFNEDNIKFKRLHINDSLRDIEKLFPGVKEQYDWLCEFVHPNSLGATAFSVSSSETGKITFFDKIETPSATPVLDAAIFLVIFEDDWKRVDKVRLLIKEKWVEPESVDKLFKG
jgi:hypothetical protein